MILEASTVTLGYEPNLLERILTGVDWLLLKVEAGLGWLWRQWQNWTQW
jgi:hypothetical protein